MDFKKTPVGSRQDNTKTLSEIKADLKESLSAWEPFLNLIEAAILKDDWKFIRDIQIPIEKALEIIKRGGKEHTEPGLEKVFISVKSGNVDVYDMTDNVIARVTDHDNKEVYLAEKDEKGKMTTRTAGRYRYFKPSPKLVLCDLCNKPTIFVADAEKCAICGSWLCKDCVDWVCMSRAGTEAVICKKCSKIYENCEEES